MTAEEGRTDLLHDWSNNNLDLNLREKDEIENRILENGNCSQSKQESMEYTKDLGTVNSLLGDLDAEESDQESHTSSLESAPDSGKMVMACVNGGFCGKPFMRTCCDFRLQCRT